MVNKHTCNVTEPQNNDIWLNRGAGMTFQWAQSQKRITWGCHRMCDYLTGSRKIKYLSLFIINIQNNIYLSHINISRPNEAIISVSL